MVNVKYLNTIDEVIKILTYQPYDKITGRNRSSYVFRGLPNEEFKLETGLKRNCKAKQEQLEKSILRNFTKYASIIDPLLKDSIWRQMIIGQHHGLPTRLLDWTFSPIVGLHFATSGEELDNMNKHNCVLWQIDIEELNALLPQKYLAQLQAHFASLFTTEMLDFVTNSLVDYDSDMHGDSMVVLEPPSIDQRIISQYACFTVVPHNISDLETFFDNNTKNTTKYIIDKNIRWRIRDLLDEMNINERSLLPGLDGLSAWLKRHYYVKK